MAMLRRVVSLSLVMLACGAAAGAIAGCGASHSCTDVSYSCNQTFITLHAPNDSWTPGTYTVTVGGGGDGGAPVRCVVSVPASPSSSGVTGFCGLGSSNALNLEPVTSCPPVVCDGGACEGMTCTPVAGHFQMQLTLQGLPAQVPVDITVDGQSVMSETITPTATTTEPNGQGCGTCTNASATASIGS